MPIDPRDLLPVGDPETVVLLPSGGSLLGLHICGLPDGVPRMLGIREDELGRPVSFATAEEWPLDITPQSNPRRVDDREDGA